MTYELIADFECHCGEGPIYHPDDRVLYWTDIPTGRMFRYDPATGSSACFYEDRPVGGYTLQADGSLLLFRDRANVAVMRDGQVVDHIIEELPDEVGTRFNDVIADPAGRVFCGTMPVYEDKPGGPRKGRLYRLDPDGSIHLLLEGIGCSNGLAFILDEQGKPIGLHYTDTPTQHITRFDYDIETGDITNPRVHVDLSDIEGSPDGMTLDTRGHIYSALWGGWGVAHFDADGKHLETFELPARNVTCPIFGPRSTDDSAPLDALYVTSAKAQEKPEAGEHAGALFRLDVQAVGLPEYRSCIKL